MVAKNGTARKEDGYKKKSTRAFNHQSPWAKSISHIIYHTRIHVTWFINYSSTDSLMLTASVVKRPRRYGVYDCCRYRGVEKINRPVEGILCMKKWRKSLSSQF
ncbi:hypothetical protein NPIL_128431 [Nephila pilipes]|uniref:Uncharacterized protein n=1 Tax=Nephila pilipes TaxID=299642 RepID=A0A8X6IDI6_NEPPI|nr:hypothetical protein NPIL_128431 [Nephila pilipes]